MIRSLPSPTLSHEPCPHRTFFLFFTCHKLLSNLELYGCAVFSLCSPSTLVTSETPCPPLLICLTPSLQPESQLKGPFLTKTFSATSLHLPLHPSVHTLPEHPALSLMGLSSDEPCDQCLISQVISACAVTSSVHDSHMISACSVKIAYEKMLKITKCKLKIHTC